MGPLLLFPSHLWYVSPMAKELTLKQRRFALALPTASSAKEAALVAGYPPGHQAESRASENVRKREIMDVAIQAELSAAEAEGITLRYILRGLKDNKERAMQERPVLDRKGKPTGEYVYDGTVANRSLELMGKHLRMFGDDAPQPDAVAKALLEELRNLAKLSRGVVEVEQGEITAEEKVKGVLKALPSGPIDDEAPSP